MPDKGKDLTTAEGYKAPTDNKCEDMKATTAGFRFERSFECIKCHLTWREDEMTVFNGKYFGIPCGCARDIPQLASKGRG